MRYDDAVLSIVSPDGSPIAVRRKGEGRPLLLVHGSNSDGSRWSPLLPFLPPGRAIFMMDRRGHGTSGDGRDYALEREEEDIAAVIGAIGTGPVDVVALSYGAICALGAVRRAGGVRRLVLYEPPFPTRPDAYCPGEFRDRVRRLLAAGDHEAVMTAFAIEVLGMPQEKVAASRSLPFWADLVGHAPILVREIEALHRFRLDPADFKDWTVPTLLLLGGTSPPQYRDSVEALHDALPGSRIDVLDGLAHDAMSADPARFAASVVAFLDAPPAHAG